MAAPDSDLPPHDVQRILSAPFPERVRLVCRNWAAQVNPNPRAVMALYWAKYVGVFIGGWALIAWFTAGDPGSASPAAWAFSSVAFQKAIVWSIFYELLGLGCSARARSRSSTSS